jgi:hypothetical protein
MKKRETQANNSLQTESYDPVEGLHIGVKWSQDFLWF